MVFLFRNMKIKIILLILIFLNSTANNYAGKINEEKSFDQIFGQKWDEKAEENGENETDQNGRIIGQMDGQNDANYGENNAQLLHETQFDQLFDQNLQVKQENATNFDQLEQLGTNFEQISEHFSNAINKKKREILEKFDKIKEKIKQMGRKYSEKEWTKIERKIAKKLGTNQRKIYKWKREFGMIKKHYYTNEEKRKILKQFDQIYDQIKIKLNEKLEGKKQKCQKIIAKHLGVSLNSIYKWKKQFKKGKSFINQKNNDEEKRQIVEKYFKTKIKFMQNGKHSQKEWKEFRAKIEQIFGVGYKTIEKWAKKLKINQNISKERKMLTIAEKMEKIKQYYQIKKQNPNLSDVKIAEILNIPRSSMCQYKAEFGIKTKTNCYN